MPVATGLAQLRLFAGCDTAELAAAESLLSEIHLESGQTLLGERRATDVHFVLVASGELALRRPGAPVSCLGPGDFATGFDAVAGSGRAPSARALSDVTLFVATLEDFGKLLRLSIVGPRLREGTAARRVSVATVVAPPVRRHRIRRRWLGAALLGLVALALGTVWVLDQRTKATPFTLHDALSKLHEGASTGARADVAPGVSGLPTGAAAAGSAPGVAASPSARPPGAAARPTTTAPSLPATGVYTYATSGGDKVSMLGAHHDYPAQTHAIVTHTGGCGWHLEQRVLQEHVDTYDWCSSPSAVQLLTLRHDIEFFSQHDGIEYHCPNDGQFVLPADATGATHHTVCSSSANDKVEMFLTVTERGTRTIGGATVPTISYHADFKMTGKATGTAHWDGVVNAITGLRIHEHRVVSTDAHAVFGDVHYDEDVTFDLLSLTPAN